MPSHRRRPHRARARPCGPRLSSRTERPGRGPKMRCPPAPSWRPPRSRPRSRRSSPSSTTARPKSSVIRRRRAKHGPGIDPPRRGTVIKPSTRASRATGTSPRAQPCPRARNRPFAPHRSHSPARAPPRPGARRPTSAASSARSIGCHSATCGAADRTLLRCRRPMKCQRSSQSSRERLRFRYEILRAVLAEVDRARARSRRAPRRRRPPSSRRRV